MHASSKGNAEKYCHRENIVLLQLSHSEAAAGQEVTHKWSIIWCLLSRGAVLASQRCV